MGDILSKASNAFEDFGSITCGPASPCHIDSCFKNRTIDGDEVDVYRDPYLSLLGQRPAHLGGQYHCLTLLKSVRYREIARRITGLGVEATDVELQNTLIIGGHCVEVWQIDQKITESMAGDQNTGLVKDGHATFYFVSNSDGTVSVVYVYWGLGNNWWFVFRGSFDQNELRRIGCRIVFRLPAGKAGKDVLVL